jgi:hypothetical protein
MQEPVHYLKLLDSEKGNLWHDDLVPLAKRGIRRTWLSSLIESITWYANEPVREAEERYKRYVNQERAATNFEWVREPDPVPLPPDRILYTTRELVTTHIIPLTKMSRAPLYALAPDDERGPPEIFISHSWDAYTYAYGSILGTLDAFDSADEEFIWIDIACYNQHTFEAVASDMDSVIKSIGKIGFAITPAPLFNRIWCLWELLCAAQAKGCNLQLAHGIGHQADMIRMENQCFGSFESVVQAGATKEDDRNAILTEIARYFGSHKEADLYIRRLMQSMPRLHEEYRMDKLDKNFHAR